MARSFNGTSQYLSGGNIFNDIDSLTIACWAYPLTTNDASIVSKYSGVPCEFELICSSSSNAYALRIDSTVGNWGFAPAGRVSNQWVHLAGTYSNNTIKGYKNGIVGTPTTISPPRLISRNDEFRIGSRAYAGAEVYFNGAIAEVGIWNVALDDMEIKALSNGYSPISIRSASLVAYYPLGGHYGQSDLDRWKNSYNLTANGSPTWTDHPRTIYQSGTRNNVTPFPDYTTLLDVIHPTNYYTIDSNYPFLSVRNNREMLLFSSTVQQTACFSRIMPRTYTGNGCHVYLYVAASTDVASTQNANFSFDVAFERVGNRVQPIDSNNFSSNKNRYYEQVPEVCGYIKCIKIPFTASQMSNIQAGELYTLRVQRSVAFDDATGTAELYAVEVRNV